MRWINITKPGQAPAAAESRWQNLGCCSPPWTSLVLRTKPIVKPNLKNTRLLFKFVWSLVERKTASFLDFSHQFIILEAVTTKDLASRSANITSDFNVWSDTDVTLLQGSLRSGEIN